MNKFLGSTKDLNPFWTNSVKLLGIFRDLCIQIPLTVNIAMPSDRKDSMLRDDSKAPSWLSILVPLSISLSRQLMKKFSQSHTTSPFFLKISRSQVLLLMFFPADLAIQHSGGSWGASWPRSCRWLLLASPTMTGRGCGKTNMWFFLKQS